MNELQDPRDRAFAAAARRALRESERLDPALRARLAAMRARVLDQAPASRAPGWAWVASGALAAGLAALVALPLLPPAPPPGSGARDLAGADAFELLTDEVEPEFYRDIEFYEWLDAQEPDRA